MSCAAVFSICLTFPGEESLKKSFDFFEEMDVHCHNRFFRFIGLSDNSIKSAESIFPEDRVYELLKIWMEKEGLKADFNSLIEALINLDQKLSAENIIAKAIINGYFKYEDEWLEACKYCHHLSVLSGQRHSFDFYIVHCLPHAVLFPNNSNKC